MKPILYILFCVRIVDCQVNLQPEYLHSVLENGLEVVVAEDHQSPLVSMALVFKSGAFTQAAGQGGWADLHRRTWFLRHTDMAPSPAFTALLRNQGISWTSSTNAEWQSICFTTMGDTLIEPLNLLLKAVRTAVIDEASAGLAKSAAVKTLRVKSTNPRYRLSRAVQKLLWGGSIDQRDKDGTIAGINALAVDQLRLFQMRYIVPNNALLVIAGDVKPAYALEQAETVFEQWPQGYDPFQSHPLADIEQLNTNRDSIVVHPVAGANLVVAWQGPGLDRDHKGAVAMRILSKMLMLETSPFKIALYGSGKVLDLAINADLQRKAGIFTITINTAPQDVDEVYGLLFEILGEYDANTLSLWAMNEAITRLIYESHEKRNNPVDHALELGGTWATGGLQFYDNYQEELGKVDLSAIRRVIKGYLLARPHVTAVAVAPANVKKLNLDRSVNPR
ncbi:MAG: insulinase family protein [Candidatus Marinimicrobia bacterium]|nr:insulinase family protein [Candidatus Neomarinimicrobiota bacterium]